MVIVCICIYLIVYILLSINNGYVGVTVKGRERLRPQCGKGYKDLGLQG